MPRTIAPYGSWRSPLSAAQATAGRIRFDHLVVDGGDLYWVEGRAAEGGRYVVVRLASDGTMADVTPPGFNVRTRVHEYGGAAFTVRGGVVYFSNFADQRLYRQPSPAAAPEPLTGAGFFYADPQADTARDRLIAVREDHTGDQTTAAGSARAEPVSTIVAIELDSRRRPLPHDRILAGGADFYSDPTVSGDGSQLAWLQWRHPHMPWDETELWIARFDGDGGLVDARAIAGGRGESIFQPEWSHEGGLFFVSDRSGFWNLYRWRDGIVTPLHPMRADFGKAQWTFSQRTYAVLDQDRLAVTYVEHGRWHLALLDAKTGAFEALDAGFEPLEGITARGGEVFFIGGSPTVPPAVVRMPLAARRAEIVRSGAARQLGDDWISIAEPVTFDAGGRDVHAFYYPPHNPEFAAPAGSHPPLRVLSHGGPTAATLDVLDEEIQYWTTRGFAVLDVNYSGSSGYGREYRDRLKGQWGVVDVADCIESARFMVAKGKADGGCLIIRGGSAGGYTTLAALAFHDVFDAGASYYGISDIEVLAHDTHKFESRYLDSLIGPYPAARDLYQQRSPIHFVDRFSCALILFQGLEDKVVPPTQSEMMAAAVRARGLPVAYVAFPGEQHGFRDARNLTRALEAELFFYSAVFGFELADAIEPVVIDNLPAIRRTT